MKEWMRIAVASEVREQMRVAGAIDSWPMNRVKGGEYEEHRSNIRAALLQGPVQEWKRSDMGSQQRLRLSSASQAFLNNYDNGSAQITHN